MRHQNDADPGLRQRAHRFPQAVLCIDVQAIARLVEDQRFRIVDQRARNQGCVFGFSRTTFRRRGESARCGTPSLPEPRRRVCLFRSSTVWWSKISACY